MAAAPLGMTGATELPVKKSKSERALIALSLFAALVIVADGFKAYDVLSIGRRPDEDAVPRFWISLASGLALGLCLVAYQRHLYRRHRDFFVAFYAATPRQRLRGRFFRWNLIYTLPIFAAVEVIVLLSLWLGNDLLRVSLLPVVVCLPLGLRSWEQVRMLAAQRREQGLGGTWEPDASQGPYLRRLLLWSSLALALALTISVLMLKEHQQNEQGFARLHELTSHSMADYERFYGLTHRARAGARTCDPTRLAAAESPAKELLRVYPTYKFDWNYGNAIHYSNLVLGRLAFRSGDLEAAKRYLLQAGGTPGSPQLDDYGPDMTLARELLESGQRETVLRYFDLCNRFWKNEKRNCLPAWTDEVKSGRRPDFGAYAGPLPQPDRGWTCEVIEGKGP